MSRTIEMTTTELRNNLGTFVEELEKGTTVVITKRGRQLAIAAPVEESQDLAFGSMRARIKFLAPDMNLDPEDYGQFHLPSGEAVDVAK